jgi:hypothetical protein
MRNCEKTVTNKTSRCCVESACADFANNCIPTASKALIAVEMKRNFAARRSVS